MWPDGGGSSLELIDVHGDPTNPANWRSSLEFGGSPGSAGDELSHRLAITEIVSNTDRPEGDAVELHNSTDKALDISGWTITDDETNLFKFKVPPATVIPAGGFLVFDQQQLGFGLDEARGGNLFVVEADAAGKPIRIAHQATFGNSAPGVSLGRWPDSSGDFWPMANITFGGRNSAIRSGDVIISEVHYSPLDPDGAGRQDPEEFEYIELFNSTVADVDLSGWRLSGDGVGLQFAEGTNIGSGETLVLLPFVPATDPSGVAVFQFFFGMAPGANFAGDFRESRRTSLEDDGGHLLLQKPGTPPAGDRNFVPLYWVDELTYDNEAPWPTNLLGNGNSLTRVSASEPGFHPSNWTASPASPGSAEFFSRILGDVDRDSLFSQADINQLIQAGKYLSGDPATFEEGDFTGDGVFNQLDIVMALSAGTFKAE